MDPAPSSGGHGTAIAGIIGAVGNNGTGMAGVSWQTRIMALRFGNASGGNVDNAITCINYAMAKRGTAPNGNPTLIIPVLSQPRLSIQLPHDAPHAQQKGLVVAAAGNNNEDNDIPFPSSYNHDIKDFPGSAKQLTG
jgi:subtilisin family serine protease